MERNIVTVISWESRFIKGFQKEIKKATFSNAILFFYEGYEEWSGSNRDAAISLCEKENIRYILVPLNFFDPQRNWLTIRRTLIEIVRPSTRVLVDITTMPRDTIWTTLFFADSIRSNVDFVYYKAKKYSKTWLSRDPGRPRLLYKMSGITEIGLPTLLLVFPGYDFKRVINLINYFEPQKVIAGMHKNSIYAKDENYIGEYLKLVKSKGNYEEFEYDTFDIEYGKVILESFIEKYKNKFNIIIGSLGPKTTAIVSYEICRKFPQVGLCYIPCKEYNNNYSDGINGLVEGVVSSKISQNVI